MQEPNTPLSKASPKRSLLTGTATLFSFFLTATLLSACYFLGGERMLADLTSTHQTPELATEASLTRIPADIEPFLPSTEGAPVSGIKRLDAIKDPANRVSEEFKVPKILERRTRFWFDIYTKYPDSHHVIHHTRYPWVIFKVVDTSEILNGKGRLWQRRQRAERLVAREKSKIIRTLKNLSRRKHYKGLKGFEKELFNKMSGLKGKRKHVFRQGSKYVRSQLGQKNFFLTGLENSSKYLPYMEKEFHDRGLPTELTRIPFVESSFNEKAESKVGASGVWQIMPKTGKAFVIVNNSIDERNSPIKATAVAAEILKRYYSAFDSWPLAVTAYNQGIGNMRRALRVSRSTTLPEVITRYHARSFKFASANFYSCFLAALHAEKYHREIFKQVELRAEPLLVHDTIRLPRALRVSEVIRLAGIEPEEFKSFNLDLRTAIKKNSFLPKGLHIHVPPGVKQALEEEFNAIPARKRRVAKPKSYFSASR